MNLGSRPACPRTAGLISSFGADKDGHVIDIEGAEAQRDAGAEFGTLGQARR